MLIPTGRVRDGEAQAIFDGTPAAMTVAADARVRQFLAGEAGDRLREQSA